MLKLVSRYSIECDGCRTLLCPDNFKTWEEAERYAIASEAICTMDGEVFCKNCRETRNNRKCVVKDCVNHANEGAFVGSLCSPCHEFIALETINYSQACRNAINIPQTIAIRENLKLG